MLNVDFDETFRDHVLNRFAALENIDRSRTVGDFAAALKTQNSTTTLTAAPSPTCVILVTLTQIIVPHQP